MRVSLGLSQQHLAERAGLSLALIQKIEAGAGNPAWATLERLFEVLGVQPQWVAKVEGDVWEQLSDCGLPLLANRKHQVRPRSVQALINGLRQAQRLLKLPPLSVKRADLDRLQDCVTAALVAIYLDYPTIFKQNFRQMKSEVVLAMESMTGKQIKLKRQILAVIGEYL